MWTLLLCAWLGGARAAVPVELPAGEPAGAWAEAARLAGVRIGAGAGAPSARIVAQGGRWTVHVVARDGTRHTLVVPAPGDAAAREDLLATVVSLAEPVAAALPGVPLPPLPPVAPPAPSPKPVATKPAAPKPPAPKPAAPKPAAPKPAATAPAEPPVAAALPVPVADPTPPEDAVATALPAPVATALPAPAEAPAPADPPEDLPAFEPPPVRAAAPAPAPGPGVPLHARVTTGAVVRLDAAAAPFLELAGGVGLGPVRAGVAVAGAPAAGLDADRSMAWFDVAALIEAGDRGPWGAVRAGVAVRGWTEGGARVGTTVTPTARLDLGWGFALPSATLRPGAWVAADLAPTTLYVAGVQERELDRAFFGIDVGFEIFRAAE